MNYVTKVLTENHPSEILLFLDSTPPTSWDEYEREQLSSLPQPLHSLRGPEGPAPSDGGSRSLPPPLTSRYLSANEQEMKGDNPY